MISYVYTLTVPAGTTKEDPVEQVAALAVGQLRGITLFFPPGPQGEVGIRVLHNRHQLLPALAGQWLAWDSGAVPFDLSFSINAGEQELVIQGHGENANFEHNIMVKIDLETAPETVASQPVLSAIDRVNSVTE
jgi:hypothetical protein